ncbi:MAG: pseudouridine-5'-phosphate glycosidase [Acidimicrobiales bacterium]
MTERLPIAVAEDVQVALGADRPVVALESTIISHGLPRPLNLEVAGELEQLLRNAGVVPATVGVVAGRPTVGLAADDLDVLARGDGVAKASVRDLPVAMAKGRHAATTVAATAFLAEQVGIRVFATGGLGGVHRGAGATFDESADLFALARTPITVVCAGVKSVLDVGATLERLETLGVTIVGYRTTAMPGFYVADSGFELAWAVSGAEEVVEIMNSSDDLSLKSAFVVANPVPPDHELDPGLHERLLAAAIVAAEDAGVRGNEVTPFLLDHIERASGGASLQANLAAVRNNVQVAAGIARLWAASRGRACPSPNRG